MSYFEVSKFGKEINLEGTICYIGLGSNLKDPLAQIVCATKMIDLIPKTHLLASSSIYKSKPLDDMNQPDYLNTVLKVITEHSAEEFLIILEFIEAEMGRTYKEDEERWASRIIDLDILLYGDEIFDEEHLIIPHNEIHKRSFVLKPLEEIDPLLTIPTTKGPLPLQRLTSRLDCDDLEMVYKVTYRTAIDDMEAQQNRESQTEGSQTEEPQDGDNTPKTTSAAPSDTDGRDTDGRISPPSKQKRQGNT